MRSISLLAAAALAIWGAPAHANIVANGNFSSETATVAGFPPDDWSTTGNAGADQILPNTGDAWDAFFGDGTGSLYQTLTTPGTTYTLSFAVAADSAAFADLSGNGGFFVCFDPTTTSCTSGTDLFGGNIAGDLSGPSTYTPLSITLTATAPSMILSFTSLDDNGGTYYVDDVDVEAVSSAVPEPSAMMLLAVALGGIGLVRRRAA